MNYKAAAAIEVSENAPAEADFLEERAVNAGNAVSDGVDQHVALHSGQDLFHTRWRLEAGIGPELQLDQRLAGPANAFRSRFFTGVVKDEGIGQRAHDAHSALGLLVLLFALLFQFFRIVDEAFDARLFAPALFRSQRFAVVGDDQAGSSLPGLDVESCRGSLRRSLGSTKQKAGGVIVGRLDFVLHRFAHQLRWVAIRRNCRWLAGKTGCSEQQNPGTPLRDGVAGARVDNRHD